MIINMGPQHPSTHGVLRLLLELDGETVVRCKPIVGYLHTGIEKNTEYRTWMQGVTFVTRADYLSPFFNELGYCLAVERLLGIEAPPRAQAIRVLVCELNRISSHLVWLATSGLELGAVSVMLYGFREREVILDIFEAVTGLRMNHAYIRIGGVIMDLPDDAPAKISDLLEVLPKRIDEFETLLNANPIWLERNVGVGRVSAERCLELGVTGPVLRSSGPTADLRKDMPYCGYETYEFDVPVRTEGDAYARYRLRIDEMRESLRIVEQALDRLMDARGAGDGRGPEGGLAGEALGRPGRDRQRRGVPAPHHGGVDGGPDPSLQARDPGRRGPAGRGLPGRRGTPRRARVLRRKRRRAPPVPGEDP